MVKNVPFWAHILLQSKSWALFSQKTSWICPRPVLDSGNLCELSSGGKTWVHPELDSGFSRLGRNGFAPHECVRIPLHSTINILVKGGTVLVESGSFAQIFSCTKLYYIRYSWEQFFFFCTGKIPLSGHLFLSSTKSIFTYGDCTSGLRVKKTNCWEQNKSIRK